MAIEIANKFQFLNERKENDLLLSYIPENQQIKFKNIFEKDRYLVNSEVRMSFKKTIYNEKNNTQKNYSNFNSIFSNKRIYNSENCDFVINFQNNTNYSHQEFDGVSLEIENKIDKKTFTFTINKGNKKFTKDLRPFMENMLKNNSSGKPFNVEFISTDFNLENYRFKIYFNDLSEDNFQNRKNINTSGGIIFITKIDK